MRDMEICAPRLNAQPLDGAVAEVKMDEWNKSAAEVGFSSSVNSLLFNLNFKAQPNSALMVVLLNLIQEFLILTLIKCWSARLRQGWFYDSPGPSRRTAPGDAAVANAKPEEQDRQPGASGAGEVFANIIIFYSCRFSFNLAEFLCISLKNCVFQTQYGVPNLSSFGMTSSRPAAQESSEARIHKVGCLNY